LAGTTKKKKTWKDNNVSFRYKGKVFKCRIKGQLVLKTMSLQEVKDHLNELPGRFAYWKSLQVDIEMELDAAQEAYDVWYAGMYVKAKDALLKSADGSKVPTEGAIKNKVMLGATSGYRAQQTTLRDLRQVIAKIGVISKAFDHQIWTLRSIATLTGQEMNNIEIHGKSGNVDKL